jgi:deoxyribodipyrimidine photo-lyase
MNTPLQRDFASREDLIAYLHHEFADIVGEDTTASPTLGGRQAAWRQLATIDPARYTTTRNALNGAVTRLSAYIRHGVLSLAEVRDMVWQRVKYRHDAEKLITELAWRDYWQRVYTQIGDGVWQDREPYKTGYAASHYSKVLPKDIELGQTSLACMDAFVTELVTTGYLHNHARMWLAAYLIHWRHVAWQAGARWFLQHLLDGDPASNNLSWQWVASTFSHKPYFFNKENLARFTNQRFCRDCPLARKCPLDAPYDTLSQQLFPHMPPQ